MTKSLEDSQTAQTHYISGLTKTAPTRSLVGWVYCKHILCHKFAKLNTKCTCFVLCFTSSNHSEVVLNSQPLVLGRGPCLLRVYIQTNPSRAGRAPVRRQRGWRAKTARWQAASRGLLVGGKHRQAFPAAPPPSPRRETKTTTGTTMLIKPMICDYRGPN